MVKFIIPSFMGGLTFALATNIPVVPGPADNLLRRDLGCNLCQLVLEPIVALKNDDTKDMDIRGALENACRSLPVSQQKCENFVGVYSSLIVNFVQQDLGPAAICAAVGLCEA
ncbi:hypothetical protein COH20_002530 [Aspergillus flavus]|uniref:Saposin B-type domain-containing protein n=1 Tax=Aspergillus flavus TaxID=5059 RepID=A0AB74BX74_ASPFL|nr:hypothetical protein COH21_012564 [Aspergillus flavus]RAQ66378.1 hypothetical protein COH20_002530 [Aspergillus flavus]RMZ37426.1 hypothetical protein CA14_011514 [Aspergillus flavus]